MVMTSVKVNIKKKTCKIKHTHESSWELVVGTDLSVDSDDSLSQDLLDLGVVEGVLQTVAEEQVEGKAFTDLVRSGTRTDSENSSEFVEHPMAGGSQALQMLLWSTGHCFSIGTTS